MNKKAVWGTLAAAIAIAYAGSTWWAGSQIRARYDTALEALPKQSPMVRVIERDYQRGFLGAISTVTLEIGCAAGAETAPPAQAPADAGEDTDASAPAPIRITLRDTIHHGPLAGGSLAAASIDSELVLDAKAQAEAVKLFGQARPLMARTRVDFSGAFTTDVSVAPAARAEDGKDRFTWQGARLHLASNARQTRARYELTMPGLEFTDGRNRVQLKLGKLSASADLDLSAGGMLATGKTVGRLESLSVELPQGAGKGPALPTLVLQGMALEGEAGIQDGLYGSTGSIRGSGKLGETPIESFEMRTSASRLEVDGYRKLSHAWMQSSAASGCGKPGSAAAQAAVKALFDQLAPDLKAMAKHGPTFGLDTLQVQIGGKRGEIQYTAGLSGVTDQDLQSPGPVLLMQRGVLKASTTLPVAWLEKLAEAGARSGQTPQPAAVAGLIEQAESRGFVRRNGDSVSNQVEYNAGLLTINGKPVGPMGAPGARQGR